MKLRQYEEEFKEERELYKEKIRGLEREISNMRANERSRSRYAVRDRSNEPIFAEENKTA